LQHRSSIAETHQIPSFSIDKKSLVLALVDLLQRPRIGKSMSATAWCLLRRQFPAQFLFSTAEIRFIASFYIDKRRA
jgi:hypothetical protein